MATLSLRRRRLGARRLLADLVRRPALLALAGTGVLAVLARVPYVGAGVGPDEGGYAYVARLWARGAVVYGDVWIDRPQGLLSVYRAIVTISDHAWAIRLGALLFGVGITVLVGAIGWMLRGPWTGVAAAAIYAVVGAGPHIQGFTLNGELLAALPATAAVAAGLRWGWVGRDRWLLAAGALGATAILMKQGGFDGLVAVAVLAVAAPGPLVRRARSLGLVVAGALVPIGLALIHALTVGFDKYWTDLVGFRADRELHSDLGDRGTAFAGTFPKAREDLLAVAALALIGLVVVLRRRTERAVLPAWLLAGIVAFNLGGLYWSHYYVQLVPPLAVLAALGVTAFRFRPLAVALTCVAIAPVAITLVDVATSNEADFNHLVPYAASFKDDQAAAAYARRNTTPAERIYVLDSRASVYWLADRRTDYPYLWHNSPIRTAKGMKLLRAMLAGPRRPRIVLLYRNPKQFDPTGAVPRILARYYREVWRPHKGLRVLVRRDGRPVTRPPFPSLPVKRGESF